MNKQIALGLAGGLTLGLSLGALGQDKPSTAAFNKVMEAMMPHMHMTMSGNPDKDFGAMISANTQAAIDLAKVEIEFGKDPELQDFARKVVEARTAEMRFLVDWSVRAIADDHH